MNNKFRAVASKISQWTGSPITFVLAILIIITWGLSGPLAHFSDTWQLIINTGTTIVTFLMVFLIQNTQNRDSLALQLKLDELIRSNKTARDSFVSLEDISDEDLAQLSTEFKKLHADSEPSVPMRKLHQRVEAEKEKRLTLKSMGEQMVNVILDPLHHGAHEKTGRS